MLDDFIEPGGGDGWFMGDLEIAPTALAAFPRLLVAAAARRPATARSRGKAARGS